MGDVKNAVARAGISSGAIVTGAALLGPVGVVGGAIAGAAAGAALDHRPPSENLCRSIDDVRKLAIQRLPPERAAPLVRQLNEMAEFVGCKVAAETPSRGKS